MLLNSDFKDLLSTFNEAGIRYLVAIVLLPQSKKEELFHFLAAKLQQRPQQEPAKSSVANSVNRKQRLEKLARLRGIAANRELRPTQEILDELREDRVKRLN